MKSTFDHFWHLTQSFNEPWARLHARLLLINALPSVQPDDSQLQTLWSDTADQLTPTDAALLLGPTSSSMFSSEKHNPLLPVARWPQECPLTELLPRLQTAAEQITNKTVRSAALSSLAELHAALGDNDTWNTLTGDAIAVAESVCSPEAVGAIARAITTAQKAAPESVDQLVMLAVTLANAEPAAIGQFDALLGCLTSLDKGKRTSFPALLEALETIAQESVKQLRDTQAPDEALAVKLTLIGKAVADADWKTAQKFFERAETMMNKATVPPHACQALCRLASVYNTFSTADARQTLERCWRLSPRIPLPPIDGTCWPWDGSPFARVEVLCELVLLSAQAAPDLALNILPEALEAISFINSYHEDIQLISLVRLYRAVLPINEDQARKALEQALLVARTLVDNDRGTTGAAHLFCIAAAVMPNDQQHARELIREAMDLAAGEPDATARSLASLLWSDPLAPDSPAFSHGREHYKLVAERFVAAASAKRLSRDQVQFLQRLAAVGTPDALTLSSFVIKKVRPEERPYNLRQFLLAMNGLQ